MNLNALGWNETWQEKRQQVNISNPILGRVAAGFGHQWTLLTEQGTIHAIWRDHYQNVRIKPAVGDWVVGKATADDQALIEAILPRQSTMVRKRPGKPTQDQVLAANMASVFILSSLNGEFNPARLERFLTMAWQSGAMPVIVLTKADLCEDLDPFLDQVASIAIGVPCHLTSAQTGLGLAELKPYFQPNQSVALVGSSGVGKSSLINALYGKTVFPTGSIREDDARGRHTTTHRELVCMPDGGVVIDSPGLRQLQVWDDGEALAQTFADIEALASSCFFRDCKHLHEPRCAVRRAVNQGQVSTRRLQNYHKLHKEVAHLESQLSVVASQERKRTDKIFARRLRQALRQKNRK